MGAIEIFLKRDGTRQGLRCGFGEQFVGWVEPFAKPIMRPEIAGDISNGGMDSASARTRGKVMGFAKGSTHPTG